MDKRAETYKQQEQPTLVFGDQLEYLLEEQRQAFSQELHDKYQVRPPTAVGSFRSKPFVHSKQVTDNPFVFVDRHKPDSQQDK